MKTEFKHVDGKIFLIVTKRIWGEEIEVHKEDVTEKIFSVLDEYVEFEIDLD